MSEQQNLLIELCTEELPPKALKQLANAFARGIIESLLEAGVVSKNTVHHIYATPRRLAIHISDVLAKQADRNEQRRGPSLQAAFDADGNPSKAAEGFARSCGVAVGDLDRLETDKGAWLVYEKSVNGRNIDEIAQEALDTSIQRLPIPKRMRWGDKSVEFVRPVHGLVALFGKRVMDISTLGQTAGRKTRGHRFHHPDLVSIDHADNYAATLNNAKVIADYDQRQQIIHEQATSLATEINGEVQIHPALLDEVTALVEWPVAIMGSFDPTFLDVPTPALVASMQDHQKYFYVTDGSGALVPRFITISNIESSNVSRVREGNERVLRARLADAQFFWETDKQQTLESRRDALKGVMYHVKLGSVADKTTRVAALARTIASMIEAGPDEAERAALLCKTDLVSDMVGEFASLQGIMGRYYADNDGEPATVIEAIEQHYWPRFSGDQLPTGGVSQTVALADRLDTLVGIFATGEKPTGVKDPYALRRAALGVLRLLIEQKLDLALVDLLNASIETFQLTPDIKAKPDAATRAEVLAFILDRLKAYYQARDFSTHEFNAVAGVHPARAHDFDLRIHAVRQFLHEDADAAKSLAAANKRISNILKKTAGAIPNFSRTLLVEDAEQALAKALEQIENEVSGLFDQANYRQGLSLLSTLRGPVDQFFDQVMVMADDEALRNNRLALLTRLRDLFLRVADISHLNAEAQ